VEKIINEVATTYNVSPDDIRSPKQSASISTPRQVSMYIVREVTSMKMEEIGKEFGGRNHSTVVYAVKKVMEQIEQDSHMRDLVSDIIKNTKN